MVSDRDTEQAPDTAADDGFLTRWSRRKQAAAAGQPLAEPPPTSEAPLPVASAEPPAPLPDPETLAFTDDFSAYLKERVPPALKKAAMKRLFADPVFNQMDGLDVYIEDFNLIPDLPAAEAGLLAHAREVLAPLPAQRLSEIVAARDAGAPAGPQPALGNEGEAERGSIAAVDGGPPRLSAAEPGAPDEAPGGEAGTTSS